MMQRLLAHLDRVRDKLHYARSGRERELEKIDWRLQINVASKTKAAEFEPEIVLDFKEAGRDLGDGKGAKEEVKHHFMKCNYANLRNLYEEMNAAYKQHDSSVNKKVRNSIV